MGDDLDSIPKSQKTSLVRIAHDTVVRERTGPMTTLKVGIASYEDMKARDHGGRSG